MSQVRYIQTEQKSTRIARNIALYITAWRCLNTLGSFVSLSYVADRQTDGQTDGLESAAHADRQSRRG